MPSGVDYLIEYYYAYSTTFDILPDFKLNRYPGNSSNALELLNPEYITIDSTEYLRSYIYDKTLNTDTIVGVIDIKTSGKRAEWTYVVDTTKVAYFTVVSGSKVDIYIKDGVSTNGVVDYYNINSATLSGDNKEGSSQTSFSSTINESTLSQTGITNGFYDNMSLELSNYTADLPSNGTIYAKLDYSHDAVVVFNNDVKISATFDPYYYVYLDKVNATNTSTLDNSTEITLASDGYETVNGGSKNVIRMAVKEGSTISVTAKNQKLETSYNVAGTAYKFYTLGKASTGYITNTAEGHTSYDSTGYVQTSDKYKDSNAFSTSYTKITDSYDGKTNNLDDNSYTISNITLTQSITYLTAFYTIAVRVGVQVEVDGVDDDIEKVWFPTVTNHIGTITVSSLGESNEFPNTFFYSDGTHSTGAMFETPSSISIEYTNNAITTYKFKSMSVHSGDSSGCTFTPVTVVNDQNSYTGELSEFGSTIADGSHIVAKVTLDRVYSINIGYLGKMKGDPFSISGIPEGFA